MTRGEVDRILSGLDPNEIRKAAEVGVAYAAGLLRDDDRRLAEVQQNTDEVSRLCAEWATLNKNRTQNRERLAEITKSLEDLGWGLA